MSYWASADERLTPSTGVGRSDRFPRIAAGVTRVPSGMIDLPNHFRGQFQRIRAAARSGGVGFAVASRMHGNGMGELPIQCGVSALASWRSCGNQ